MKVRMARIVAVGLLALLAVGGTAMAGSPRPVNQARPVDGSAGLAAQEANTGAGLGARLILEPGESLSGEEALAGGPEQGAALPLRSGGGSCVTGAGAVLECPKSGGPSCGSEKVATCRCIETTAKTWTAITACVEPSRDLPEGAGGRPAQRAGAGDPRKRTSLAGCNGGTCNTSGGLQLSCPASGGPACDEEDICVCHCAPRSNGSWSTNNTCYPIWGL